MGDEIKFSHNILGRKWVPEDRLSSCSTPGWIPSLGQKVLLKCRGQWMVEGHLASNINLQYNTRIYIFCGKGEILEK